MRQLITKYAGECRKCAKPIEIGETVIYEKRVGIFCPGCEPTDVEDIRAVRQEAADRKADRLEEWAEKREAKAEAALNSYPEIRHDWAFITQPGHIPFRERMNRSVERACESLAVARHLRARADGLRKVRVAGDAETKRQRQRDFIKARIAIGTRVEDGCYGAGVVKRINQKSATIQFTSGFTCARDLSYLYVEKEQQTA